MKNIMSSTINQNLGLENFSSVKTQIDGAPLYKKSPSFGYLLLDIHIYVYTDLTFYFVVSSNTYGHPFFIYPSFNVFRYP